MEGYMHQFVYRVMQQLHRTSSGHFSHRCLLLADSLSGCRRPLWLKRPELVLCGCYVSSLTNQCVHVRLLCHSHMPNHASLLVACTVNVCCMNTFCRQAKKCGSLLTDHIKIWVNCNWWYSLWQTTFELYLNTYMYVCTVRWYNIMHIYIQHIMHNIIYTLLTMHMNAHTYYTYTHY